MRSHALLLVLALLWPISRTSAHDSPEHSIEELTEHIRQEGASVPLLLSRASDYRVLGRLELAIADLQQALKLEPKQVGALVELARIHLTMRKIDAALRWSNKALAAAPPGDHAYLYALRADIYAAKNQYQKALSDYNRALTDDAMQVDWYLNRARLQELLRLSAERIAGLAHGTKKTGSVTLENEWIEALIDGGQADRALPLIESHLRQARLKSSWRIRRARALSALNSHEKHSPQIQEELNQAISEINARLNPSQPDPSLLLDRALAYSLMGEKVKARHDIDLAQKHGATIRQVTSIERRCDTDRP